MAIDVGRQAEVIGKQRAAFLDVVEASEAARRAALPRLLPFDEIMATDYPAIHFLDSDRLFPAGGLVTVAGEPKCMKSYILQDLARVYSGSDRAVLWLGRMRLHGGKVVVLTDDCESTESFFKTRMLSLGAVGTEQLYMLNPRLLHVERLTITDAPTYSAVKAVLAAENLCPTDLLIIDSLNRVFDGEENRAADIDKTFRSIRGLCPATKMLVHHLRKPCVGDSTETLFSRVRGSIDVLGASDAILLLKRKGHAVEVHTSSRYAVEPEPFRIEMHTGENGRVSFVFSEQTTDQVAAETVHALIQAHGKAIDRQLLLEQAAEAGISERSVVDALGRLMRDKRIAKQDNPDNRKMRQFYAL